jgi:hypothetical protein
MIYALIVVLLLFLAALSALVAIAIWGTGAAV